MSYFFSFLLIAFGAFALKTDVTQIQAWGILAIGIIWLARALHAKGNRKVKGKGDGYTSSTVDYTSGGSDSSGGGD